MTPTAATQSAVQRAEELAQRVLPDRRAKKRMLVIVNPYATTVSNRLKNLVVYALQGRYDVEAVDTNAQRPRHRAHPRGGEGGLRRGGGVRRRRHRERGRERAGRIGHARDLPAGRRHERLRPHARDPERRGGCHRAPAADRRRLPPAQGGHRPGQRPPLRVRLGGRPRRERGAAGGLPSAPEGALRRVLLHLRGHQQLHPPLPARTRRRCSSRRTGAPPRRSR